MQVPLHGLTFQRVTQLKLTTMMVLIIAVDKASNPFDSLQAMFFPLLAKAVTKELTQPAIYATIKAVEFAKKNEKIISYDPNWRPPLWENDIAAKDGMEYGFKYADILKISEAELEFLTGESSLDKGSIKFFERGIKLIVVTLGQKAAITGAQRVRGIYLLMIQRLLIQQDPAMHFWVDFFNVDITLNTAG